MVMGGAVKATTPDGGIHLVEKLAKCVRKLRKGFVHEQASLGDVRGIGWGQSLSIAPSH